MQHVFSNFLRKVWGSSLNNCWDPSFNPQRVTVWCVFWIGGVICPFFFTNEESETVAVNGQRYRTMAMPSEFLWSILVEIDLEDVYFPQDDATSYTSGETITVHRRLLRLQTLLDFFLLGYVNYYSSGGHSGMSYSTINLRVSIWN